MLKPKYLRNHVARVIIGLKKENELNARSGRAAVKATWLIWGYTEQDYDLNKLYEAFLKLARAYSIMT